MQWKCLTPCGAWTKISVLHSETTMTLKHCVPLMYAVGDDCKEERAAILVVEGVVVK